MKKHLLALSAAAVLLAPQTVGAEGFSIIEWSAEGFAMGGARMFAENDAANFAYNPAAMTKIKGEVAKVSAAYISPHGKYKTYKGDALNDEGHNRVHPAWAPGSYYVKQLNDKEWIGFGAYSRFGNSCQFEPGSMPGYNNTSAKLNGMSIGMNYAKKLDNKWSASLGAEVNYAWLQLDKTVPHGAQLPLGENSALVLVAGKAQVEGESYALGWNAAASYAFDDKNEMGIVYRSAVNHSMEANVRATDFFAGPLGLNGSTEAYGCVTLPESVTIGYGHKFNDRTRVELNGIWTRWSRFDSLDMSYNKASSHPDPKNWKDGWRYAIGVEHKLSDKYSLLGGIAHDESAIPDYDGTEASLGADFMVPTGTRTTFALGTQYHDEKQTLAFTVSYMKVGDLSIEGDKGNGGTFYDRAKMYDSYTKLFLISYQYNF